MLAPHHIPTARLDLLHPLRPTTQQPHSYPAPDKPSQQAAVALVMCFVPFHNKLW